MQFPFFPSYLNSHANPFCSRPFEEYAKRSHTYLWFNSHSELGLPVVVPNISYEQILDIGLSSGDEDRRYQDGWLVPIQYTILPWRDSSCLSCIYMGKPVALLFGQLITKIRTSKFRQESRLPFVQISSFHRKTARRPKTGIKDTILQM